MQIRKIEHYNIRTTRLAETVRFYEDVLGMKAGQPPGVPANFPANWIYDGSGTAAVHLIDVDPKDPAASYATKAMFRKDLKMTDPPAFHGSGAIDHIAFECADYDAVLHTQYAANEVPQIPLRQLFVLDPNGITLELNFRD